MKIDLHVHTKFSDGEYAPSEVLRLCKENNVNVVAITDHNNMSGGKEAIMQNPYSDIKVIPGIEIEANYPKIDGRIHILGYNVDVENKDLNHFIKEKMQDNIRRIESLLYELKKNNGMVFDEKDITKMFSACGNIGRPEVAKLCVKYNYASSVEEAFENILKPIDHKLAKRKVALSDEECIKLILNAGGVACLAHPITLKKDINETKKYIEKLTGYGLEAVEVYYSMHNADFTNSLLEIVNDFNLLYSVGSDFHGPLVKPNIELGNGIKNNLNFGNATILSKILRSD